MFGLAAAPIDENALKAALQNTQAGGFVSFEGWVRNHNEGKRVISLEYEAFESLALLEGERILEEARKQFDIFDCRCVHRVGHLDIGQLAVWVGVNAAHRGPAFEACQFIINEIKVRLPIWKKEHYTDGHSGWVNCQGCATHHHPGVDQAPMDSSAAEMAYYSRQMRLPEIGQSGQDKLKQSRVLVIGAGGLGCPALLYLAAAGVGTIGICEFDSLEMSNLHRQVAYSFHDTGKPKGSVVAERINQLNPFISTVVHSEKLSCENALCLIQQYDLVLDCTDNFIAKFLIHDAAFLLGIPLIQASIYQYEGQIQLCMASNRPMPCLRCLWPEVPDQECIGTCAEVGVLGAVPGVLGTLQALEALKLLLGLPSVLAENLLLVNLLTHDFRKINRQKNEQCPLCGKNPIITEIHPSHYQNQSTIQWELEPLSLNTLDFNDFQWVDIRESIESQADPLPWKEAIAMPLSRFDLQEPPLERSRAYLFICQKGVRSKKLVSQLQEQGFCNAYSLKGGIENLKEQRKERLLEKEKTNPFKVEIGY